MALPKNAFGFTVVGVAGIAAGVAGFLAASARTRADDGVHRGAGGPGSCDTEDGDVVRPAGSDLTDVG
ncbi:hypothetical protein OG625_27500 [Streptomyces sp. NBC_01351]|uniref:hypothetical protein n=1 Tax=Streptomyces sp. NBC_01351 TaxID=2903833 RepID=UPI002E349BE8|nr:hypothetical protein [Streptomyces sp. NBC_01351]